MKYLSIQVKTHETVLMGNQEFTVDRICDQLIFADSMGLMADGLRLGEIATEVQN